MRKLKETIKYLLAAFYSAWLNSAGGKRRRVVLYYHGVKDDDAPRFRRQMAYIADNFSVIKPSEVSKPSANITDHEVVLTFDDAFVSILENALPVLKEYGLPAGIAVPTGNIGRRPDWDMASDCPEKDDVVMSEKQIAAIDRDGFEILSHTVSHPRLTGLNESELEVELTKSKQQLERIVGHEVSAICYPHGAYDSGILEVARRAGYKLGFTTCPENADDATDLLSVGRYAVSPADSLAVFKLKARGAYKVVRYLSQLKRLFANSQKTRSETRICSLQKTESSPKTL